MDFKRLGPLFEPKPRHSKGLTGFGNAFVAAFSIPTAAWSAIDGNWGVAVFLLAIAPFAAREAVCKRRAGNWW